MRRPHLLGAAAALGGIMQSSGFRLQSYPCDLCGSSEAQTLLRKPGALIREPFAIVRCRGCGHVRVSPRVCDEQIPALYDDAYYTGRGFDRTVDYTQAAESNYRGSAVVRDIIATVSQLFPRDRKTIRALDFGCGLGDLALGMRDAGFESYGFDSSEYARGVHLRRGVPVLDDFAAAPEKYHESFDLITCVEVIEHTTGPTDFLRFLRTLLKPGGFLFVLTGNWHVQRRLRGTPYIMPEGHIQYFSPKSLSAFLRKAGFAPQQVDVNYAWFANRMSPIDLPHGVRRALQQAVQRLAPEYGPLPIGRRDDEQPAADQQR